MARRKVFEVNEKDRRLMLDEFFEIIAKLKNKEQVSRFFKDLLTPGEALMLTRRVAIAKLLLRGYNFKQIEDELKVGANTISSVNRWLYTGFGGYVNELKGCKTKKEFKGKIPKTEWERIKKKYPAHFLIFNAMDNFKNK